MSADMEDLGVLGFALAALIFFFQIMGMSIMAGQVDVDWQFPGWLLLFVGTILIVWLSHAVTTKLRLFGYTLVVIGLCVAHGFYLHYVITRPQRWTTNVHQKNRTLICADVEQYEFFSDFSLAAFMQDLFVFIFSAPVMLLIVGICWSRVWKGEPIAPWWEWDVKKRAKKSSPTKSTAKVCIGPRSLLARN